MVVHLGYGQLGCSTLAQDLLGLQSSTQLLLSCVSNERQWAVLRDRLPPHARCLKKARFAPSAILTQLSQQSVLCQAMKRKHDALMNDQSRVDSAAEQSSFAQSKMGQYLQGQDLLTESVFCWKF